MAAYRRFVYRKGNGREIRKKHPIGKTEYFGKLKPRIAYNETREMELDNAPLLEKYEIGEYYGKKRGKGAG